MTAVALTAPAPGTTAGPATGKTGTDAGAGFANALLTLLAGPATDTPAAPGQQATTVGNPGPQDTPQPSPLAGMPAAQFQPALPAPAVAAAPAVSVATVPAAATSGPALPAALPAAQAPATVPAHEEVAAALSAVTPVAVQGAAPVPAKEAAKDAAKETQGAGTDTGTPVLPAAVFPALTVQAAPQHVAQTAPSSTAVAVPPTAAEKASAALGTAPAAAPTPRAPIQAAPSPQTEPAAPATAPAVAATQASVPSPGPVLPRTAAAPDAPVTPTVDDTASAAPTASPATPAQQAPVQAAQAPAAPVPVPKGYTAQLARPLFTIATAGPGEHTMTVELNPQNLGPVTLHAHSSANGIRIEMFAATADGRDTLRQALPELKKDLAGAGISASLDLSSNGQGSAQGGQDRETFTRRFQTSNQTPAGGRPLEVKDQNTPTRPGLYGPETTLDVLA